MSRPRKVSDEEIFAATIDALIVGGPLMSVQQVAERLHVSQPALFRRFDTKFNLIVQALRAHARPIAWRGNFRQMPGPDAKRFRAQLIALCETLRQVAEVSVLAADAFRALGENRPVGPMAADIGFPTLPELRKALVNWLAKAEKSGLLGGDSARPLATALIGGANFIQFLVREGEAARPADIARYVDFLLADAGAAPSARDKATHQKP